LAKKARLDGVNPRHLRHTAVTFVTNGAVLLALQAPSGPSTFRSTEVYLHMDGSLREIHAAASPADRLMGS